MQPGERKAVSWWCLLLTFPVYSLSPSAAQALVMHFIKWPTLNAAPTLLSQFLALVWRSFYLEHPCLVPVVGVVLSLPGMPDGMAILVTECCELGPLTSVSTLEGSAAFAFSCLGFGNCKSVPESMLQIDAPFHCALLFLNTTQLLETQTMEIGTVKALDITKDLARALAYLHSQVGVG